MTVLDQRALNRATLARQMLLDRADLPVADAVAHLCGLQAQEPQEPYVGLWSRLRAFDPAVLSDLLVRRRLVRTHLMRRTVHLLAADDVLAWRSRHDAMLRQRVLGVYRGEFDGVDLDELAAAAPGGPGRRRAPHQRGDRVGARRALAGPGPPGARRDRARAGSDRAGPAARTVADHRRRPYRRPGPAGSAATPSRLGRTATTRPGGRWCGATWPRSGRPRRRTCAPGAALPGCPRRWRRSATSWWPSGTRAAARCSTCPARPGPTPHPAPVRFLPAFDNAVLGYHDRSRIIDDAHRNLSVAGARFVLVDGRVAATWTVDAGVVVVTPLRAFTRAERTAVAEEGAALASFLSEGDNQGVRVAAG